MRAENHFPRVFVASAFETAQVRTENGYTLFVDLL
ncbi:hypothetical protein J2Z50_004189 [Ensifer mexicanus]|nr:hypothetical protein [Sinorhizobium mexicanum]